MKSDRDDYQFHRHLAESQRFVPRARKPAHKGIDWESVLAAAGFGFWALAVPYVWLTI